MDLMNALFANDLAQIDYLISNSPCVNDTIYTNQADIYRLLFTHQIINEQEYNTYIKSIGFCGIDAYQTIALSPLLIACNLHNKTNFDTQAIGLLLNAGADVHFNHDAAFFASLYDKDLTERFLELGVSANTHDCSYNTALHSALSLGYENTAQLLLENGASLIDYNSPLPTYNPAYKLPYFWYSQQEWEFNNIEQPITTVDTNS